MSAPSKNLTITMYRELLRGSERHHATRPRRARGRRRGCARTRRFAAETRSPRLAAAASLHGAACLPELTRSSFRGWADQPERALCGAAAPVVSRSVEIVESELATALP